jgi:integrase
MKLRRDRYKEGSLRRVPRRSGRDAWEFRYTVMEDGVQKWKQVTVDSKKFPTETAVRNHVAHLMLKVNDGTPYAEIRGVTFDALLGRYIAEELPERYSTQRSYLSIIERHLRPRWGKMLLSDIKPGPVYTWLRDLKAAPKYKGHIRSLLHRLFELAMLWELLDLGRNPIGLVKLKGVSKRQKRHTRANPCAIPVRIRVFARALQRDGDDRHLFGTSTE